MVTKSKIILFMLIVLIFTALFICYDYTSRNNESDESIEATESSSVNETVEIVASTEQTEAQSSETTEASVNETIVNVEVDNTNIDTNIDTNVNTNVDTNINANTDANLVSLGEFLLTAYCPCSSCCGQWAGGATASGVMPVSNHTIAVDTGVISFGTEVIINGITYVAEDTGGAIRGNRIDIYFDTHQEALNFGVQYAEVFIVTD